MGSLEEGAAPAWQRRIGSLAHRAFPPRLSSPSRMQPCGSHDIERGSYRPAQTLHRVMTSRLDAVHLELLSLLHRAAVVLFEAKPSDYLQPVNHLEAIGPHARIMTNRIDAKP